MNQLYQTKLKELVIEFTRYLTEHPELAAQIPSDAQIVLLDRNDPFYSQQAIQNAQQAKHTDDLFNRPILYIEVQELAPIRSRVRKLAISANPPLFAVA